MQPQPHEFWQTVCSPGELSGSPEAGYRSLYPATLADGRQIALPIRVLPGDGRSAVASLIVNQASFAVLDTLADAMAALAVEFEPEVVIGVPTLGLPLAEGVARRLGHKRMVALGTSRKFWYDEALSQPLASITSPSAGKRIYLDPRMLPLLNNRRVVVVDDVISTGASMRAVLALLAAAGVRPVAVLAAMLQGEGWRGLAAESGPPVLGALATPRLTLGPDGAWRPLAQLP